MSDYIEAYKEFQRVQSSKRHGKLEADITRSRDRICFKTGSRNVCIDLPMYDVYAKSRTSHEKVLQGLEESRSRLQYKMLYMHEPSHSDMKQLDELNAQIASLQSGINDIMTGQNDILQGRRAEELRLNGLLDKKQLVVANALGELQKNDDRSMYNYVQVLSKTDVFDARRQLKGAVGSFHNPVFIKVRDTHIDASGSVASSKKPRKQSSEDSHVSKKKNEDAKDIKETPLDYDAMRVAYKQLVKQTKDDVLTLYNKLDGKYDAGDGPNEKVSNPIMYKKLNTIKDWRSMLTYAHVCPFKYDDATYNTIQHAFMAQKAKVAAHDSFADFAMESKSQLSSGTHDDAREMGASIKLVGPQKEEWKDKRDDVLSEIFMAKLEQCNDAAVALVETYGAELWMNVEKSGLGRFEFLEDLRKRFVKQALKKGMWTPKPIKHVAKKKLLEAMLLDNGFKFANAEQCATAKRSLAHYMSKDDIIKVIDANEDIAQRMPKGYKTLVKEKLCDVLIEKME